MLEFDTDSFFSYLAVSVFIGPYLLAGSEVNLHDLLQKLDLASFLLLQVFSEDLDADRLENKFTQVLEDPGEREREFVWALPRVPVEEEDKYYRPEHVPKALEIENS